MRSTNYAYSIAFEFFLRKGKADCHKLAKAAVSKYEKGQTLISAMKSLL